MKYLIFFVFISLLLFVLFIVHLFSGSTSISFSDFTSSLTKYDSSNISHVIARDLRLTRAITAIVAGGSLAISGLLMQTIFQNPLADPNILGVSTGASLFVAMSMSLGLNFMNSNFGVVSSALLGSFVFGCIILFFTRFIRDRITLLLVGIMLGSFSSSILSLLNVFSDAQRLKSFSLWSMGSLQHSNFSQLPIIIFIFIVGLLFCFLLVRSLNALLLGEENAFYLGINSLHVRIFAVFVASLLTGLTTAFCGPIAFVGIAVPNLVRLFFKTSNHLTLIIASVLLGACFMLFCDISVQFLSIFALVPINIITSIIGAPFVVFIILKRLS